MNEKKRYYKIADNGIAYYFTTPEEMDTFLKKSAIKSGQFTIVDIQDISATCKKEIEILTLKVTF